MICSDNSVITCGEIVRSADSVSTNIPTDFPSAVSIILHNENIRYKMDYYIAHTVLLVIILLLMSAIVYYHYVKCRSKLKSILPY